MTEEHLIRYEIAIINIYQKRFDSFTKRMIELAQEERSLLKDEIDVLNKQWEDVR